MRYHEQKETYRSSKEDTSNHFHIFVGDLSNEVNDEVLTQAFSAFGLVLLDWYAQLTRIS
jgi:RNA recognition motif-containing protein